jgi:hypothetical protein
MDRKWRTAPTRIRGFLRTRLVGPGTILPSAEQIRGERVVVVTGRRGVAALLARHG